MPSSSIDSSAGSSSGSSSGRADGLLPLSLPALLPDLRFEQSYLASVQHLVHEEEQQQSDKQDGRKHKVAKGRGPHGEKELWLGDLRVEWLPLMYITLRDQLVSPLVQGALWGLAGLSFGHLKAFMASRRSQPGGRGGAGKGLFGIKR